MNRNMVAAILIGIGGLLGVIGAFIAARQAIRDGEELDRKNQRIAELSIENTKLTRDALDQITGGKSFGYIRSGLDTLNGIGSQSLWFIHVRGNILLYDVSIEVSEISHHTSPPNSYGMRGIITKHLGTVVPSLFPEQIGLITYLILEIKLNF
jgi:uncharacterized membrane protein YecN with MAPEG domain